MCGAAGAGDEVPLEDATRAPGTPSPSAEPREPTQVVELLLAALGRDGAAVLEAAAPPTRGAAVATELAPYVAAAGGQVGAVVARYEASWPLALHPVVLKLCDAVLGRQALRLTARGRSWNRAAGRGS